MWCSAPASSASRIAASTFTTISAIACSRFCSTSCPDFGVEIELSAQIAAARRWRIYEVAVNYFGRTYQEGKKITWADGLKGLWYIGKFRLRPGHVSGGKSA